MTRSTEVDDAPWAIEIEREKGIVDYFSVVAFKATGDELHIVTHSNQHITFQADKIRKLLVMKAKHEEAATT